MHLIRKIQFVKIVIHWFCNVFELTRASKDQTKSDKALKVSHSTRLRCGKR